MARKLFALPGGFDLWRPLDECPEHFTPANAGIVYERWPDATRWMMVEQECWLPRNMRERLVEPPEAGFVPGSPGLILDRLT